MRICLISREYPPETGGGGIGTQTFLKAQGLTRRGHEVHGVSSARDDTARTYMDGLAIIHRIPQPSMGVPGYEESSYWLAYSAAVAGKIAELNSDVPFDIMQFPEYGGEGFIYQTDTFANRTARYVVQLHGPLGMFAKHCGWPEIGSTTHQVGSFLERTAMHHSDLVLASSHNTAAFCAEEYQYPLPRIGVIHSGIDTAVFQPQSAPSRAEGEPRLLFVGKLSAIKGFDLAVDTVLRMVRRYPNIRLRTIGRGSEAHINKARARVAAANAQSNIEILGYVPYSDLPNHYAWCDLFVGPSDYEPGPGNIYLEAMACAKPVVACDTAGTPEVVRHGQTGLLTPPQDSAALESAIDDLIRSETMRLAMGRRGRQWVVENFSIERYLDKVEGHYLALLGGRQESPEATSRSI